MKYRNGILATIAYALTSVALAGVVYTDAYSHAAKSEAHGLHALTEQLSSNEAMACVAEAEADPEAGNTLAAPALLSANPSATVRQ